MPKMLRSAVLCSTFLAATLTAQTGWSMSGTRPAACTAAPGVTVDAAALGDVCAVFDRARAARADGDVLLLQVLALSDTGITLRLERIPPLPMPMERSLSIVDRALSPEMILRFIERMMTDLPPA